MKIFRKILKAAGRTAACIPVLAIMAAAVTGFSPVYRFGAPAPFKGPDIFDPYRNLDTAHCWKRANFHTHTRVDGLRNECEFGPAETYAALEKFGYDIVTFSNHNELTVHPYDTSLQVNVYEHGYNLFKYHKLVFGCDRVRHYDHLLPILSSQKQFQLNYLGNDADLIQINHPLRTWGGISKRQMERLSGYMLMELDSGKSTENEYWDWALSAGHYSFGVANDDLHYPDRSSRIAVRCNFLCCPSATYEDIRTTLLDGCFYSMRVPDYGRGDWALKYEKNRHLPSVKNIGLKDTTVFISVSCKADSIKVTGQGHRTLAAAYGTDFLEYGMKPSDTYARFTVFFPEGEVIYSNPFARYTAEEGIGAYSAPCKEINLWMTVLFNLLLLLTTAGCIYILYKIFKR